MWKANGSIWVRYLGEEYEISLDDLLKGGKNVVPFVKLLQSKTCKRGLEDFSTEETIAKILFSTHGGECNFNLYKLDQPVEMTYLLPLSALVLSDDHSFINVDKTLNSAPFMNAAQAETERKTTCLSIISRLEPRLAGRHTKYVSSYGEVYQSSDFDSCTILFGIDMNIKASVPFAWSEYVNDSDIGRFQKSFMAAKNCMSRAVEGFTFQQAIFSKGCVFKHGNAEMLLASNVEERTSTAEIIEHSRKNEPISIACPDSSEHSECSR